jgi:hypothetical protein
VAVAEGVGVLVAVGCVLVLYCTVRVDGCILVVLL